MVSCIILTAGSSSRFGSPKALAQLNGSTVIEHLIELLGKTKVDETIIVLGADAELIKPNLLKHKNINIVYNKDHKFGQTSSFKVGLESLASDSEIVLLLPVDYPLVMAQSIGEIADHSINQKSLITIPTYNNIKGHPPCFRADLKEEFLNLSNDQGLNTIAREHKEETSLLPLNDPGITTTFNTKEEFEKVKVELKKRATNI